MTHFLLEVFDALICDEALMGVQPFRARVNPIEKDPEKRSLVKSDEAGRPRGNFPVWWDACGKGFYPSFITSRRGALREIRPSVLQGYAGNRPDLLVR